MFSRPDPEQFQSCFVERTQAASLPPGAAAAMDGRTVRRSRGRGAGRWAIRLVSAWASVNTLTPGQVRTEEKSNGTTAIPRLPEMPELNGCIVTIDAMGCRKEIARGIVDRGADCLPAPKEDRGRLCRDVGDLFEAGDGTGLDGSPHGCAATLNRGRGRIERRERRAADDPACLECPGAAGDWAGPGGPGEAPAGDGGGRRGAVQYYTGAISAAWEAPAERQLAAARDHWSTGNLLHRSMDVTFREGQSRVRRDRGPPEHGRAAADIPQPAETGDRPEGGHTGQAAAGRMAGGPTPQGPPRLRRDCPA